MPTYQQDNARREYNIKQLVRKMLIPYYLKIESDIKMDKLRRDFSLGVNGSIDPTMSASTLNSLPDGLYLTERSGQYNFPNQVIIGTIDGVTIPNNTVPTGYDLKFYKQGNTWRLASGIRVPAYNDEPIKDRLVVLEQRSTTQGDKITLIEQALSGKVGTNEMNSVINAINQRISEIIYDMGILETNKASTTALDSLRDEVMQALTDKATTGDISDLNDSIQSIISDISNINNNLNGINQSVSNTNLRIDEIEQNISGTNQALDTKVDKVDGKGLSTNDFTDTHKTKVGKMVTNGDGKLFLADDGTYKKAGSGSGSGFYNVAQKYPLAEGYYTIQQAISLIAKDEDVEEHQVVGMIMTIETEKDVWQDYRFIGETKQDLDKAEKWIEQSVRNVVKRIQLSQGVETSQLTPDENGDVHITIPSMEVDDTLTEGGTNPVQGGAILATIRNATDGLASGIKLNVMSDGTQSLSLLDGNGNIIDTSESFKAGGDGGGGEATTTKVVLTKLTDNLTIKSGTKAEVTFLYDQKDAQDNSTGIGAVATVTITRGATSYTYNLDLTAGASKTLDVTQYLAVGTTNVRVRIVTNDEAHQVSTIAWTITVVQLKLESSFNIASNITKGNNITIPYALTGSGTKTLELYHNGVQIDDKVITSSSSTGSFVINTSNMTHSVQAIQIRAKLELSTGEIIYSNTIYFGVAVIDPSRTTTLISTRFDYLDGRIIPANTFPTLTVSQYSKYSVIFAVYTPNQVFSEANVYVDNTLVSKSTVRFARTEVVGRAYTAGTIAGKITSGSYTTNFNLEVEGLGVDLTEPTDGLLLKLVSDGKTNSDIDKEEWKYNDITTKFDNMTWVGDGWVNGALRLIGANKATINFTPLAQGVIDNNAFTFSTRFKVSNTSDANTEVIKCMDSEGVGFVITSQEARMITKGNSVVTTKFADGEEYNIGFVSFPPANADSTEYEKTNSGMLYLYVDGVMSGGILKGDIDQIYQSNPANVVIEPKGKCTIDIYAIRSYSKALTDAEMLNNYLIDLADSDKLMDKFIENNILDSEGNISVESLPPYLPYMIITGKAENGRAMVLEAATINNKDTKYDVEEILFINPLDPSMNFKNTGGCIRLQGTSSLAYPIKNYRIYFQNKSKENGILLQGVDKIGSGGTLLPDTKYSFKKATPTQKQAIPVNCFCLKADYAESSSSHNTGTARIVHEVTKATGDLTPAQKNVSPTYNYDIRTTIDGFPMVLFYRANLSDTPVFLSKFNFNNDKSTEDVFGFKGIPGYHDQPWVTEVFNGVNPTECWEFLNNDYPMGMFKDDDFDTIGADGKANWTKVFEARYVADGSDVDLYESGAKKPTNLERVVKWIKSTDTKEAGLTQVQKDARALKFRTELSDYFDISHLCTYYQFTDILGAVDQRVKNMMIGFWYDPEKTKMLAYMIFYDNDTILGVRNDGTLKYNWDIDHNTLDTELGTSSRPVYAFAGHDSVLWENLRNQFKNELKSAYVRIRGKLTNDYIFNMYNNEQSKKFVERIYNLDAINKYVVTSTKGVQIDPNDPNSVQVYSYLGLMHGSRTSHRKWWLTNRLNLMDAKYSTGNYRITDLTWKGNSPINAKIKATASREYYFAFHRESAELAHRKVNTNEEVTFTYDQEANIGTIFHLYGGDWAKKIDLSEWGGFTSINIPKLKVLEEFILGRDGKTYTLPNISIGSALPLLKKLDIRNYTELSTLDLSQCSLLEEVNATGCLNMSAIKFYSGSPLSKVRFPVNYKNLTLVGLPKITNAGITFDNIKALEAVYIDQCPKLDSKTILDAVLADLTPQSPKKYLRVNIGNFSDDGAYIRRLNSLNLGGMTTTGQLLDNVVSLTGNYQLTNSVPEAELATLKVKFPELNILRPEYTVIEYDLLTADPANLSNLDNKTGYKFGNTYKPSGALEQILNAREKVQLKRFGDNGYLYYPLDKTQEKRQYLENSTIQVAPAETYGGTFILEPEIYYKGINDHLGNKNYVLWAKDKPTDLPFDRIVFSALKSVETGKALDIREDFMNTILITNPVYSVCTIPVTGKTFVRFPSVISVDNSLGWLFLDASNNIIKKGKTDYSKGTMQDGMYVIDSIPANAVEMKFTILTSQIFDPVRLTNRTNYWALEEWVKRDKTAFLAGTPSSYANTQYWIPWVITTKPDQWASNYVINQDRIINPNGYQGNDLTAKFRHYKVTNLVNYNILRHFFYAVFGTRDVTNVVGKPEPMYMGESGIQERILNTPDAYYNVNYSTTIHPTTKMSVHKSLDVIGNPVYSNKTNAPVILGYANFATMIGETIFPEDHQTRIPFKVNVYSDKYSITQTIHGKNLDIIPIKNNIVGTASTYFSSDAVVSSLTSNQVLGSRDRNMTFSMNTVRFSNGSDMNYRLHTVMKKFTKATSAEAFVGQTEIM